MVEKKANKATRKLGETKLKFVETANVLFAWDKKFADYKGREKALKQTYYNRGFKHAEDSVDPVIF